MTARKTSAIIVLYCKAKGVRVLTVGTQMSKRKLIVSGLKFRGGRDPWLMVKNSYPPPGSDVGNRRLFAPKSVQTSV